MQSKNPFKFNLIELNKKVQKTFFYDLGFYAFATLILGMLAVFLRNKIEPLVNKIDYSAFFSDNLEAINQGLGSLKVILVYLILFILISIIALIILFTFFKGIIWIKLLNKKFSKIFFRKYLFLNFIYLIPALIIILFVFFKYKNNYLTMAIALPIVYFHTFLSYFLTESNKIKDSFKQASKKAIDTKFFAPCLLIIVGFIALSQILNLIPYYSIKPIINLIIFIFYFSIIRNYIKNIIKA